MHYEAEFGIVAHWYYSEEKYRLAKSQKKLISLKGVDPYKIKFVQQLQDWKKGEIIGSDFINLVKIDFLKSRVFVFTPKGDVVDLPEGSTPIDFAYYIHTDIGNHCCGTKIDGVIAPI